jgi:hypothetical protein
MKKPTNLEKRTSDSARQKLSNRSPPSNLRLERIGIVFVVVATLVAFLRGWLGFLFLFGALVFQFT